MLEARTRTVYYSPRKRRHFMTLKAAAKAEANSRMNRWFPGDQSEYDERGYCTYPGWDWRDEPRLTAVHSRLVKRYMRQMKTAKTEGSQ